MRSCRFKKGDLVTIGKITDEEYVSLGTIFKKYIKENANKVLVVSNTDIEDDNWLVRVVGGPDPFLDTELEAVKHDWDL